MPLGIHWRGTDGGPPEDTGLQAPASPSWERAKARDRSGLSCPWLVLHLSRQSDPAAAAPQPRNRVVTTKEGGGAFAVTGFSGPRFSSERAAGDPQIA